MHLYYLCPSWHPVPEMLFFYLFKCQSTKDSFLVLPLNLRVLCLAFLSSNTCSNTQISQKQFTLGSLSLFPKFFLIADHYLIFIFPFSKSLLTKAHYRIQEKMITRQLSFKIQLNSRDIFSKYFLVLQDHKALLILKSSPIFFLGSIFRTSEGSQHSIFVLQPKSINVVTILLFGFISFC